MRNKQTSTKRKKNRKKGRKEKKKENLLYKINEIMRK